MNVNQAMYRFNLGACVFHIFILLWVISTGDFPALQLGALVFNGSLALWSKDNYKKSLANELPPAEPTPELTAEMCPLWEIRRTELKMLDAGVITDMEVSVCENHDCPECFSTRRTQRWAREAEQKKEMAAMVKRRQDRSIAEKQKAYELEVKRDVQKCLYCHKPGATTCNACRMEHKAMKNGNTNRKRRVTLSSGITIDVPPNVPKSALPKPTMSRGGELLTVKWFWDYDGKDIYSFVSYYERIVNWTEFGGDGSEFKHTSWVPVDKPEVGFTADRINAESMTAFYHNGLVTTNELREQTEKYRELTSEIELDRLMA